MSVSAFTTLDQAAIEWLLQSDEPGIVIQTHSDVLGDPVDDHDPAILAGPRPRAADAIALLRSKQQPDGRWHLERPPRWLSSGGYRAESVRWERSGPSEMLTLKALRVLHAAQA